jgi:hypothetical protein
MSKKSWTTDTGRAGGPVTWHETEEPGTLPADREGRHGVVFRRSRVREDGTSVGATHERFESWKEAEPILGARQDEKAGRKEALIEKWPWLKSAPKWLRNRWWRPRGHRDAT